MTKKKFIKNLVVINVLLVIATVAVVVYFDDFIQRYLSRDKQTAQEHKGEVAGSNLKSLVLGLNYTDDPLLFVIQKNDDVSLLQYQSPDQYRELFQTPVVNLSLPLSTQIVTISNEEVVYIGRSELQSVLYRYHIQGTREEIYSSERRIRSVYNYDNDLYFLVSDFTSKGETTYNLLQIDHDQKTSELTKFTGEQNFYIDGITKDKVFFAQTGRTQCKVYLRSAGEVLANDCDQQSKQKSKYAVYRKLSVPGENTPASYPQGDEVEFFDYVYNVQEYQNYQERLVEYGEIIKDSTKLDKVEIIAEPDPIYKGTLGRWVRVLDVENSAKNETETVWINSNNSESGVVRLVRVDIEDGEVTNEDSYRIPQSEEVEFLGIDKEKDVLFFLLENPEGVERGKNRLKLIGFHQESEEFISYSTPECIPRYVCKIIALNNYAKK